MDRPLSDITRDMLDGISNTLFKNIKRYLDIYQQMDFSEPTNMTFFPDHHMISIVKQDDDYLLMTSKGSRPFELTDFACVRVDDLLWIVTKIEEWMEDQEYIASNN